MNKLWSLLFIVWAVILPTQVRATSLDWQTFKHRFMAPDGRIIDTGNHNISHTEGQGFSMLFAVSANDQASFRKIWRWTDRYLYDSKSGVFFWKYNPVKANPIEDTNNASDGDMLIAWALLKASIKWQKPAYKQRAKRIVDALYKDTVIKVADYQVILPGRKGFIRKSGVVLNPSYFIFPALQDFSNTWPSEVSGKLLHDSLRLLHSISWGRAQVPSDWIKLFDSGKTAPADSWPARVSYDGIRVPLYLKWFDAKQPLLSRWKEWFDPYKRLGTPAWQNVLNHQVAPYPMSGGLLAVRDFTFDQLLPESTKITTDDDYYSASLKCLVALASSHF